MAYNKLNMVDGDIFDAASLAHVEGGIEAAAAQADSNATSIVALSEEKVTLPTDNSAPDYGTAGQFAVSDGAGGITWKTLYETEEVSY